MFAWLKKIAAPVAAVALIGFATAAQAAVVTVEYYTVGSFGGVPAVDITNGGAPAPAAYAGTSSVDVGGSTLFYDYSGFESVPYDTVIGGFQNVNTAGFGQFYWSSTTPSPGDDFSSVTFTLEVYQLDPLNPGGPGVLAATMVGVLASTPTSTVDVTFTPNTTVIASKPQVTYLVGPTPGSTKIDIARIGRTDVDGNIELVAVPLPSAATVAVPLLVGFGLLSRRRKVSVA